MSPFKTGHVPHHSLDARELQPGDPGLTNWPQGVRSVKPPPGPRVVEHEVAEPDEPQLDVEAEQTTPAPTAPEPEPGAPSATSTSTRKR